MASKDFILASGSPQRHQLLTQIGLEPKQIVPADIDEHALAKEMPLPYIRRIAKAKAIAVAALHPNQNILSADTVIVVGQKIIQKSPDAATQTLVMRTLSGRTHRVITSVCLIDKNGKLSQRTVTTKIVMKHLTEAEIKTYIESNEWQGVAGYKIEGLLAGYVKRIIGSYTSVVGLPLYEAKNMLNSAGVY
ncbi:MAG: septum formation protein Maf [Alphaproteobacteria bacterium]|nr:septum formation protein Maf [Alphaproteobacteria bacterium]